MGTLSLQLLVGTLSALPFIIAYWVARWVVGRRQAATLRPGRPWQRPTLEAWVERGWLEPELVTLLPEQLSPAVVFYEWARADPGAVVFWRLSERLTVQTPFEVLVRDAWAHLPAETAAASRETLAGAVRDAGTWWGGAERGWNGR